MESLEKQGIQVPRLLNRCVQTFETALSKRIFWAVMTQIKKGFNVQADIYNEVWFNVPVKILNDYNFKRLDKATDELQKVRFITKDPELEEFYKLVFFPEVKYKKRSGNIDIRVDQKAIPILSELSHGYFWLKLKSLMLLNSAYAQRWYELFSEKRNLGQWQGVTVDYIREIMGVEDTKYKSSSDFLRRVVYLAVAEINEKTEFYITYEPMRGQKRPILGFDFTIKGQNAKNEANLYTAIEKHFEAFNALEPMGKMHQLHELQQTYSIPQKLYDLLVSNSCLLDAVLATDLKLKKGIVQVQTTKEKYMGGVIKKAMDENGIKG